MLRRFRSEAGLRDGRRGHGRLPTWRAGGWPGSGLPIDHVLVKGDVEVIDLEAPWVEGSDHAPLRATLRLGGPAQRTAPQPAAPRIGSASQPAADPAPEPDGS